MLLDSLRSALSSLGLDLLVACFRCRLLVQSLHQRQQRVVGGSVGDWLESLPAQWAVAEVAAALGAHAVTTGS